jgi:hypothetical protein
MKFPFLYEMSESEYKTSVSLLSLNLFHSIKKSDMADVKKATLLFSKSIEMWFKTIKQFF